MEDNMPVQIEKMRIISKVKEVLEKADIHGDVVVKEDWIGSYGSRCFKIAFRMDNEDTTIVVVRMYKKKTEYNGKYFSGRRRDNTSEFDIRQVVKSIYDEYNTVMYRNTIIYKGVEYTYGQKGYDNLNEISIEFVKSRNVDMDLIEAFLEYAEYEKVNSEAVKIVHKLAAAYPEYFNKVDRIKTGINSGYRYEYIGDEI